MKSMSVILLLIILFLFLSYCNEDLDSKVQKGKAIAISKCFNCHAPMRKNLGPPLESFYAKFGNQNLEKYLIQEFVNHKNLDIEEHKDIGLSKEEVEYILAYLKILSGELLPY